MKKNTDSNYKSRSLQKYSSSKTRNNENSKKDINEHDFSKKAYERRESFNYGYSYEAKARVKHKSESKVRRIRHKEKVKKQKQKLDKKTKRTRILFSILGIALCTVGVLFGSLMYRYSLISELKYDINNLSRDLDEIKNQKKEIEVELEHSNRSDVIEKIAMEQLQMQYPSEEQIVYIEID